ncbi:HOOK domain [Popillia japonica]|uniref:Protein hook n=1 Tax=Popillia japonica TaxID=7064 RepID=A0AAW1MZR2_POPJA
MDPSHDMCKSLMKWFQTLVAERARSVIEMSDGVAMYHVLTQISPEHFSKLDSKIKLDVGSNWRLKVSNLKKINESILEFYQDVVNSQVLDIGKPDVVKLGEMNDLTQLGKILRLILGCAVNCDRKQEYITQIMALEESVQQSIMLAIQQLEEVTCGPGRSGLSLRSWDTDSRIMRLISELDATSEAKETLNQQCRHLEQQLQSLQEEKQALLSENHVLMTQIKEKNSETIPRNSDNRRQMELLKEEIFKLETMRDDYTAKMLEQEKQIHGLQEKNSELQLAAEATNRLKDEVDALSETADKVQALETALMSYKKKLEDYTDIKKQLKTLEDKNVEYLQLNMKYEEEFKKQNVWKSQSEVYKNQAAELQQKLDEQTQKSDKILFLNKNLESKFEAVQAEKDRLVKERDMLREENEELKIGHKTEKGGAAMAQELIPTEMKERLRFLEKENSTLRSASQDVIAKQALLDDAMNRIKKLTDTNRACNQKVLELEAQLEEQSKPKDQQYIPVKEHEQKINNLQEILTAKENEYQILNAKYMRNVEKAKEVANSLDIKSNGSIESIHSNSMKEHEEKLITSAFYRLSSSCHREAVDERLAVLSAGQGQSFLSRQRQPTPRKPVTPFKSK